MHMEEERQRTIKGHADVNQVQFCRLDCMLLLTSYGNYVLSLLFKEIVEANI